jgi:hypothetical protein
MYFHVSGFEPGVTYSWRVDEIDAAGTVYPGDLWRFTTAPLTAYQPSPWDGAKWVDPQGPTLSWSAAAAAVSHDVYLGPRRDDVAQGAAGTFKGNQLITTHAPGALLSNTTRSRPAVRNRPARSGVSPRSARAAGPRPSTSTARPWPAPPS